MKGCLSCGKQLSFFILERLFLVWLSHIVTLTAQKLQRRELHHWFKWETHTDLLLQREDWVVRKHLRWPYLCVCVGIYTRVCEREKERQEEGWWWEEKEEEIGALFFIYCQHAEEGSGEKAPTVHERPIGVVTMAALGNSYRGRRAAQKWHVESAPCVGTLY